MKSSAIKAMLEVESLDPKQRSLSLRHLAPSNIASCSASKSAQLQRLSTLRANIASLGADFGSNASESRVLGSLLVQAGQ